MNINVRQIIIQNVSWSQEADGVIVMDEQNRLYWKLFGLEGELWSWFVTHLRFDEIIEGVSQNAGLTMEESTQLISNVLNRWENFGLIEIR